MSNKEDVINSTISIWILGQMFGLCSSGPCAKIFNKTPTKVSKARKIIYWSISIFVTIYLSFYNFEYELDPTKNIVIQAGDILNGLSSIAAALGCIFTSLYFESRLLIVMRDLYEVNNKFKTYPKEINYNGIKRFAFACIIYTLNSWIYFLISYLTTCQNQIGDCFWSWILMYTITKVFDVNLIRFVCHMSIVYKQLSILNANIIFLSKEKANDLNIIKEMQRIQSLDSIKELYEEILRIAEEINKIYSISLLFVIANQFISIFSSLYFCFFGYYINGIYIKPDSFHTLLVPLMSLVHPGGQLLATAIICQLTISESKHTGKIIFQIPINRNNRTLMRRINLFALHIMHKQFDITASGFFSINCSLLLMIVGAVTVYLVMFIQFDLASRKQITQ